MSGSFPKMVEGNVAVNAYPDTPQVVLVNVPKAVTIINMDASGGDDLYVSFDGVTDHGRIVPGAALKYTEQYGLRVFMRAIGAGTPDYQVVAE